MSDTHELYYSFRAKIHAKRLSRETLESELARALVVLHNRNARDARDFFGVEPRAEQK